MTNTRARACTGKRRHDTRDSALDQITNLGRAGADTNRLTAYRCRHCNGWHVGHLGKRGTP